MRLSRASGPPLKPSASTISSLSASRMRKPCSLTTSRPSTILNAFIRLWATSLPSNSKTASSLNQPMLFNQLPVHIFEATSIEPIEDEDDDEDDLRKRSANATPYRDRLFCCWLFAPLSRPIMQTYRAIDVC